MGKFVVCVSFSITNLNIKTNKMNNSAPETNKEHVKNTLRSLKKDGIKSPNINEMSFHIHYKTSRTWYFYRQENEKHYRNMIKKLADLYPCHIFELSHP